jgi:hypothetical protein
VLARRAVKTAIRRGDELPLTGTKCVDCGASAEHYHHFRGYEPEHWLWILPVCRKCHGIRHRKERATWMDARIELRRTVAGLTAKQQREIIRRCNEWMRPEGDQYNLEELKRRVREVPA